MEKLKFFIPFENSPTIVHLCPKFQELIPVASSDEITSCLVQVITQALLFHFHSKILNFSGQNLCLGHPKMCISTHMEIRYFSMYRAGYTRKRPRYLCRYAVVLKIVAYRAANVIFKVKYWWNSKKIVQDGARMEREGAWWCWRGTTRRYNGSTSVEGLWVV